MLLEQHKDIEIMIINSKKYPDKYLDMYDIIRDTILKYYHEGDKQNKYVVDYDITSLGEKEVNGVEHILYLLVLRDISTGEYVVSTIEYVSDNKNYHNYSFRILDKEENNGN